MKKPAVICRNLVKTYGEGDAQVVALRGVDLDVNSGEILMLVGPSGCGKTTFISIISSILKQDSGDCIVFGKSLNSLPEKERTFYRGKHIGFVFQSFNLVPMLTAQENISVPLIINGMDRKVAMDKAAEMMIRVGLEKRMHHLPMQLSGGEQQRIAILRGCVHDPELIVCDEPTSALDHQTGEKVLTLLRELTHNAKHALVIVTHDARIFHYADRIAKMDDGRIVSIEENVFNP